jgi:hypothetical protein
MWQQLSRGSCQHVATAFERSRGRSRGVVESLPPRRSFIHDDSYTNARVVSKAADWGPRVSRGCVESRVREGDQRASVSVNHQCLGRRSLQEVSRVECESWSRAWHTRSAKASSVRAGHVG